MTRDRLRQIIREEKDKMQKKERFRRVVREEAKRVLHEDLDESEKADKAAKDADDMMGDENMSKDVAAKAAAKKHDTTKDAVKKRMGESDARRSIRDKVRNKIRDRRLDEVRPKDYRTARRKLARYLESHAITDTQMDDLVSLVSQQGLPGGLDEWMDMHAESFNNLNRNRLEDLLVSSGVAQP